MAATVLIIILVPVRVTNAQPTGTPSRPGGGGGPIGEQSPCTSTPAACQGASRALPGQAEAGTAGSTLPAPGCQTGRVVTTDGAVQSDSMPFCPDSSGGGAVAPSGPGAAGTTQVDTDGDGTPDAPAPPPPPPPPTHPEIVAAVCPDPPVPVIGHNPREYGITGMHTWLWSAGDNAPRSASGVIRTYPVTCKLTAARFDVDTGDDNAERYGHPRSYTSTAPGSETETTEMQHFWEVKGTYPMTLTITWTRVSNYGSDSTTATASADYPVKEIVVGMTAPQSD